MDEDLINQFILWKPLKAASIMMYLLVLVLLPFSQFWAAIMLFAIICLWSRIPALITMFLNDLEVIDFFTVMLAIHVGGLFAGIFGASMMLFSRIFGPNEWLPYTIKDATSIFAGGLATPFVFAMTGSPLYTLYIFTAIRYSTYLILTLIFEPQELLFELGISAANIVVAVLSNTLVMSFFEDSLSRIFEGGLHFSITLFAFTTLVMGGFYLTGIAARRFEQKRQELVSAGEEEEFKPPFWALDEESKPAPRFVKTD